MSDDGHRIAKLEALITAQNEAQEALLQRVRELEGTVAKLSLNADKSVPNTGRRKPIKRTGSVTNSPANSGRLSARNTSSPANAGRRSGRPTTAPHKPRVTPSRSSLRSGAKTQRTNSAAAAAPTSDGSSAGGSAKGRVDLSLIDDARKSVYHVGKQAQHVIAPSWYEPKKEDSKPPEEGLAIEHIYGYNGRDGRNNISFTADGEGLIYHVAGAAVVQRVESGEQKFFLKHTEDISCLSVSPVTPVVATGQRDPKGPGTPCVQVWNYETMSSICKIEDKNQIRNNILCVSFGANSEFLYIIDHTPDLAVYRGPWHLDPESAKVKCVTTAKVGSSDIYAMVSNPHFEREGPEMAKDESKSQVLDEFVTLGKKHLKYFTLKKEGSKYKLDGHLVSGRPVMKDAIDTCLCAKFLPNHACIVGTASGKIYVIRKGKLLHHAQPHKSAIGAIEITKNGFLTSGFDGLTKMWKITESAPEKFTYVLDWQLQLPVPARQGTKAIAYDQHGDRFAIGTRSCSLFLVDKKTQAWSELVKAHSDDVWGLTMHPKSNDLFVSAGYDGSVRLWNMPQRKLLNTAQFGIKERVTCTAFTNSGAKVAIGFLSGRVVIARVDDFIKDAGVAPDGFQPDHIEFDKKLCNEQVSVIRFSPSDKTLAVGSFDQKIHLVNWNAKTSAYRTLKALKGHSSSITSLQWSEDGQIIASCSKSYETLTHDIVSKSLTTVDPDTKWHKWSNLLGWPVKGIFGGGDGTDVNTVEINSTSTLSVSGTDFGEIQLMRWPSLKNSARRVLADAHASFVCAVNFSCGDDRVVSVGGHDLATIQWRVTNRKIPAGEVESKAQEAEEPVEDDSKHDEVADFEPGSEPQNGVTENGNGAAPAEEEAETNGEANGHLSEKAEAPVAGEEANFLLSEKAEAPVSAEEVNFHLSEKAEAPVAEEEVNFLLSEKAEAPVAEEEASFHLSEKAEAPVVEEEANFHLSEKAEAPVAEEEANFRLSEKAEAAVAKEEATFHFSEKAEAPVVEEEANFHLSENTEAPVTEEEANFHLSEKAEAPVAEEEAPEDEGAQEAAADSGKKNKPSPSAPLPVEKPFKKSSRESQAVAQDKKPKCHSFDKENCSSNTQATHEHKPNFTTPQLHEITHENSASSEIASFRARLSMFEASSRRKSSDFSVQSQSKASVRSPLRKMSASPEPQKEQFCVARVDVGSQGEDLVSTKPDTSVKGVDVPDKRPEAYAQQKRVSFDMNANSEIDETSPHTEPSAIISETVSADPAPSKQDAPPEIDAPAPESATVAENASVAESVGPATHGTFTKITQTSNHTPNANMSAIVAESATAAEGATAAESVDPPKHCKSTKSTQNPKISESNVNKDDPTQKAEAEENSDSEGSGSDEVGSDYFSDSCYESVSGSDSDSDSESQNDNDKPESANECDKSKDKTAAKVKTPKTTSSGDTEKVPSIEKKVNADALSSARKISQSTEESYIDDDSDYIDEYEDPGEDDVCI